MIPTAVITAFAHGRGVAKNDTTNQSLHNADNQPIPETITVDGNLYDTGWDEFISVDSASGVWDAEVDDIAKANSYEYRIRSDYEYLYGAFRFDGSTAYGFKVFFKTEGSDTAITLTYTYSDGTGTLASSEETVEAPAVVTANNVVEFKYRLTTSTTEDIYYYVCVDYTESASLYHPAIFPDGDVYKYPAESWDDNALTITANDILGVKDEKGELSENTLPEYVDVDGNFTEAYWASLANYHVLGVEGLNAYQYKNPESGSDILSFDNVKYSQGHFSVRSYEPTATTSDYLTFKMDVRMDQKSVFGAAIIYDSVMNINDENGGYVTSDGIRYNLFGVYIFINGTRSYYYEIIVTYDGTNQTTATLWKCTSAGNKGEKISTDTSITDAAGQYECNSFIKLEFRIDFANIGITVNKTETDDGTQFTCSGAETVGVSAYSMSGAMDSNGTQYCAHSSAEHGNEQSEQLFTFTVLDHIGYTVEETDFVIDGSIDRSNFKALNSPDSRVYAMYRTNNGSIQPGNVKQYGYTVESDNEYIYGAAVVEMLSGINWVAKANDNDLDYEIFCLWINNTNVNSGNYTHVLKLYLQDGETKVVLVKAGDENNAAEVQGAEAVIVPTKDENGDDTYNKVVIEFKVPLRCFDMSDSRETITAESGATANALLYYVGVESHKQGTCGTMHPIGSSDRKFVKTNWGTCGFLNYNGLRNQVYANANFSEEHWIDAKFIEVNDSNADYVNDCDKNIELQYKLYTGYEALYGAIEVNTNLKDIPTAAECGYQVVLWIRQFDENGDTVVNKEGYGNKFTQRFVFRYDGKNSGTWTFTGFDYAYHAANGNSGGAITIDKGYDEWFDKFLKYNVQILNGKTQIEFILDYDTFNAKRYGFEYYISLEEVTWKTDDNGKSSYDSEAKVLYPARDTYKTNSAAYVNVAGTWDETLVENQATAEKLTSFIPETIIIDGNLSDSGWDENAWIKVAATVNGTSQNGNESLYAETYNNGTETNEELIYRFQVRQDGEYLYVAAVLDCEYSAGDFTYNSSGNNTYYTNPSFRIWINSKDENGKLNESFEYLYDISAGSGDKVNVVLTRTDVEKDNVYDVTSPDDTDYDSETGVLTYTDDVLRFAQNLYPNEPNGGAAVKTYTNGLLTTKATVTDLDYKDSVFYGYTEEIQENLNNGSSAGQWYADPQTNSFTVGNEHAVINSDKDKFIGIGNEIGTGEKTIVEFKVKISEFDPNGYGFEYSVQATKQGYRTVTSTKNGTTTTTEKSVTYSLHYPVKYCEPGSNYNAWGVNFPYWTWYNGIDAYAEWEDTRLRNNYAPVTTLGAKISSSYEVDGVESNAIRFGAVYHESYIRYLDGKEDADYWNVSDMGIVIYPTDWLEGKELTLETEGCYSASAENIVNWTRSESGWGCNFADYENFVFYVTLYGMTDDDLDDRLSARGYITFYLADEVGGPYYDTTVIRSYNMVDALTADSDSALEEVDYSTEATE